VADIRANRVPKELVKAIKQAILDREIPSIREAAIEAFEIWLSDNRGAQATPELGLSLGQDQLSLANTVLGDLESAHRALDNAIHHVRTAATQASTSGQPVEDGVVPHKATRRRKTGNGAA